jgi:hypothetical protein
MEDSELRETLAREIFNKVVIHHADDPEAQYFLREENGQTFLQFDFGPYPSHFAFMYDTTQLVEDILSECEAPLDTLIAKTTVVIEGKNCRLGELEAQTVIRKHLLESFGFCATRAFLANITAAIMLALFKGLKEAILFAEAEVKSEMMVGNKGQDGNGVYIDTPGVDDAANDLMKRVAATEKDFITQRLSQFPLKPNLKGIGERYKAMFPIWREVKKLYTKNKRGSWQSIIAKEYPMLPDDLIQRLAKTGESAPSDIAIEHAARLCGASRNYLTARQYFRLKADTGDKEAETPTLVH